MSMDFLALANTAPERIRDLVTIAGEMKRNPANFADRLAGKSVGLFFMKPSTRTRVSSEVGTRQLGAYPVVLKGDEVGIGGRETADDVGRVLDRYLDAIAMRVFDHRDLESIATAAEAPVINLLSDLEHPCQAIADVLTVAEHRPGASIAYVGDGNNVLHSLMVAATMTGSAIRIATPAGYEPDERYVALARTYGDVMLSNSPSEAVDGADCVYTDVWTSMGQEAETAERLEAFTGFMVDETLFARAATDAIFLHCLPAHRGEEVSGPVMAHSRSRVFEQAENRLHAFKAVLLDALG